MITDDLDQIYYVTHGKAKIQIGKKEYEIGRGNSVFVKAEVDCKFKNIRRICRPR